MRMHEMMTSAADWLAEVMPALAGRSSSDALIRRALIAKLRSQGRWDPHRCTMVVRDGIVRIAGIGASAHQKIATRAAAESTPGVRGFEDSRPYGVAKGRYN